MESLNMKLIWTGAHLRILLPKGYERAAKALRPSTFLSQLVTSEPC